MELYVLMEIALRNELGCYSIREDSVLCVSDRKAEVI